MWKRKPGFFGVPVLERYYGACGGNKIIEFLGVCFAHTAMSLHNHVDEIDVEHRADKEDGVVDEDMEVLQRAYRLVGVNPEDYIHPRSSSITAGDADPGSDSNDVDDFELLRDIQNRFSIVADEQPLSTLSPVSADEEEDEFEMLRSIQRRFAAYESDTLSNKPDQSRDYDGSLKMDSDDIAVESQTSSKRPSMLAFEKGSLPKAALAFVDAIKKNRSQQKFIRSKMIHLEARIEENKKLRKRCKILKDFQCSCKRRTSSALSQMIDPRVQLISAAKPQAKDSSKKDKRLSGMYYGPAENSHVACHRMALAKFPRVDRKKWSIVERENLGKGIRQQFQEMVLQISVDQFSGQQGVSGDSDDLDNILASIKDLDIAPEKIREFLPKVNWDKLASMYLQGRSGAECEARWLNFEDPLINRDPWTASEDKNLLFTIQQKGLNNWIEIAVSLGTNRTPFQCLSRYQRSLNASILKREWTKDEDDKLRSAVAIFGVRDWQAVASTLEGRAGTQCSNRGGMNVLERKGRGCRLLEEESAESSVVLLSHFILLYCFMFFLLTLQQGRACDWVGSLKPRQVYDDDKGGRRTFGNGGAGDEEIASYRREYSAVVQKHSLDWYRSQEEREAFVGWDDLKQKMLVRFRATREGTLVGRFLTIKQETIVEEYRNRFDKLLAPVAFLPTVVLEETFMNGLNPWLKSEVETLEPNGLAQWAGPTDEVGLKSRK
ncbi:snRNA-activating protein complex subunit 4 [Cucumis melo var. makuwa]|uniref:snRNA-activating protein complex subunit 4 n=1 Tax=Cucumis melo var. makuwa TaxID=1194695 RepID=A0A5D3BLR5_CUCMM|nr:snRNA-activating protein complex subunit 4 [Cucumis melo var. makuwa]TYK00761.1 snRNA-activating protein complex subunit 4 [Cucumis melo var. makuwa]